MEYTELADYPMHEGHVLGWVPNAGPGSWRDDERRLSTDHESHVGRAHADPDRHRGSWIGGAFRIAGPLLRDVFAAALADWLGRHEAYRTTAVATDTGWRRRTVAPESVEVAVRPVPEPCGGSDACARLEEFFAEVVSSVRWPHLAVVTVEPDSACRDEAAFFTVVFAADHTVMDAYTQAFTIGEFTELYRARLAAAGSELPPCGSYVDFSAAERAVDDALDATHPAVRRWGALIDTGFPGFPLPLGPGGVDGGGQQASLSRWLLDAPATESFVAAAKRFGGSQTSGFVAAVKSALGRLGADGLRFVMPMHTRYTPELATAAGWFVGVMPVDDRMDGAGSFGEAVPGTAVALRANRDVVPFSLSRITDLLGVGEAPQFVVSYIDGRAVPGANRWSAHDRVLRSRVRSDSEVYLWINRAAGGLNLSMRYPNNDVATASVHAFVAEFAAVLTEVASHGDASIGQSAAVDGSTR
ncbi:condensation domain-containing protein [Gordonia humi]|uniref:Condensation domain-containing protein n=1 Tax=Gordonia humi TaxID=686429 RepID=A0A840EPT8_9ACTN|nr:condensation domain-containing protein [Gordonia humi]MBB4134845.1 hypothetical protein [Gordonia humi]